MMKRKAIKAELRKESQTFPGYYKYELDIQEEDGSVTTGVPAYGKDLQDALQRTVKHDKIEMVERKINRLPEWFILLIFMVYMTGVSITSVKLGQTWPIFAGMGFVALVVWGLKWITTQREIND
jgi:hypothetical protein